MPGPPDASARTVDDEALVSAKLRAPDVRPSLVARPGLLARVDPTPTARLTLVVAPAGWGKTTLLLEWRALAGTPTAWLALERADNDPVRFWTYVVHALRGVAPGVGAGALAALKTGRGRVPDRVLPGLLEELAALPAQVALVLDDLHEITSPEVHDGLRFVVEHQPPTLHLLVTTRADPPLPLGRLRARGNVVEVRADQLRFSAEEARELLTGILDLDLTPEDVARLHARTEGWAAGLYLAALSIQGQPDPAAFVAAFAGDDRHVVDYLGAEVLDAQDPDVREFLLLTSVLERLSGPLCNAVTGRDDSDALLERIERSNLFLVPLDTRRRWFRYHHLFGELLRDQLERTRPALVRELHARAADWYAAAGEAPEAISHALAAGRADEGMALIERHWNAYFNLGRVATVSAWLDGLPSDEVRARPALCVPRAWVALDLGRLDDAGGWISCAEEVLARHPPIHRPDPVEADVAVLRTVHCYKVGDLARAEEAARSVTALDPGGAAFRRTVACVIRGAAEQWSGAPDRGAPALEEALRLAEDASNLLATSYSVGFLALAAADAGDLERAEALAGRAAALAAEHGFDEHFVTMIGRMAAARVDLERGRLAEAEVEAEGAVRAGRHGAGRVELAAALLRLAEIRAARGGAGDGDALVGEAAALVAACPDPGLVAEELARARGAAVRGRRERPEAGDELTEREAAVLRLLATRLSLREVADALFVSQNTVKTHARGIYRKLGVASRAEAVARARRLGLLAEAADAAGRAGAGS